MTAPSVSSAFGAIFAERSQPIAANPRLQGQNKPGRAEAQPSSFQELLDSTSQENEQAVEDSTRPAAVVTEKAPGATDQQNALVSQTALKILPAQMNATAAGLPVPPASARLSLAAALVLLPGAAQKTSPRAPAAEPKMTPAGEGRKSSNGPASPRSAVAAKPMTASNGMAAAELSGQPAQNANTSARPETEASRSDASADQASTNHAADELRGGQAVALTPAAPPALSGDLSFAMKISSDNFSGQLSSTVAAHDPAASPSAAALSAAVSGVGGKTTELTEHRQPGDESPTGSFTTDAGERSPGNSSETARNEEATPNDAAASLEAELEKAQAEPVRGAHVQIAGDGNQRVDIRLVERSGQLAVTVRSADPTLTRALQESSNELNTNLHAQHYRTELWTPGSQDASGGRGGKSQHSDPGANGSSPDNSSGGRQNRKQQPAPEWAQEAEEASAAFQKRIDYVWHQ